MLNRLNITTFERMVLYVIFFFFMSIGSCLLMTTPRIGCVAESHFKLKPESRLPKWFTIPEGHGRNDLTVEISYYGSGEFKAVLLGPPPENKALNKQFGIKRVHPESSKSDISHYPAYYVGTVNGVDEIIEHRAMEPYFYISDDPSLKKNLKNDTSN